MEVFISFEIRVEARNANRSTIQSFRERLRFLPLEGGTTFDGIKTASGVSFQIDIFVLVKSGSMKGVEVMFPLFLKATT